MEAVLDRPSFLQRYQETHDNISEVIEKKYESTILKILKNYVTEQGVAYDDSISTTEEFRKTVISKLSKAQQTQIADFENNIRKELTSVMTALKNGSQTAFSKFTESFLNVGGSALKLVAKSTAIKVAVAVNPTLAGIGVATSIIAPTVVKGIARFRQKKKEKEELALNAILIKLCVKKDEDNKFAFNLSEKEMNQVFETFSKNGITINKDNDLKFLADLLGLDSAKKEKAINIINQMKLQMHGEALDIAEEKKQYMKSFSVLKEEIPKITKMIASGVLVGANIGNTLNSVAKDEAAAIITGLTTGGITGNPLAALCVGGSHYALSKFGSAIPLAGGMIEEATSSLNSILNTGVAIGVSLGFTMLFQVIPSVVKSVVNWIKSRKDKQVPTKPNIDNKPAIESNNDNKPSFEERLNETSSTIDACIARKNPREISLEIVRDALKSAGVDLPSNIVYSNEQLLEYSKSLDKEQKTVLLDIVKVLTKANKLEDGKFKKAVKVLAKSAYWGSILALLGLGVYDKFNPGYIEALREKVEFQKLFNNTRAELAESTGRPIEEITDAETMEAVQRYVQNQRTDALLEIRNNLPETSITDTATGIYSIEGFRAPEGTTILQVQRDGLVSLGIIPKGFSSINYKSFNFNVESFKSAVSSFLENMSETARSNYANYLSTRYGIECDPSAIDKFATSIAESEIAKNHLAFISGCTGMGEVPLTEDDGIIDILNHATNKLLEGFPTRSSTDEETIRYFADLPADNTDLQNAIIGQYVNNNTPVNFFDLWHNAAQVISDQQNNLAAYDRLERFMNRDDFDRILKTQILDTSFGIAGVGAGVGASLGAAVNLVFSDPKPDTKKNGFFGRTWNAIKNIFHKDNNPALPEPESEPEPESIVDDNESGNPTARPVNTTERPRNPTEHSKDNKDDKTP